MKESDGKEGQRLKKILNVLLLCGLCALFIFGLSLMVEGPADCSVPDPPLPLLAEWVMESAPSGGVEMPRVRKAPERVVLTAETAVCSPPSDRNGHPVSAGPYVRVVYAAFPPEWRHG